MGGQIITTPGKCSTVGSAWTRWGQLLLGITCMVMTANLQYGWTLFIDPIEEKYHWGRAAIQVAFTIFIVTETWAQPIGGYRSIVSARRLWSAAAEPWWRSPGS